MELKTNIKTIKELSLKNDNENWRFRYFLKSYDGSLEELDSLVRNLAQFISKKIDCKTCANCCKEVMTILDEEDIEIFARGLKMPVSEFMERYIQHDAESGAFTFNQLPCPFLKDNLCTNYEFRPKTCRSYPHLYKEDFIFRLMRVIENCSVCPVVFNVYERLKDELWYNRYFDFLDDTDDDF